MLKINKILSKKIQFPLSLRGAKQRSNRKGFSLIELMVAVVILAMAIFGIFHAYSVGFMGMVDARAITVATNYAREAMEDIKNMDFGEIELPSSDLTINGIIYNRQVIVTIHEDENIKRVITIVTWTDRNNKQKIVETDMLVYFIETTAGDATRIMLTANPYNVLTGGGTSILSAVIKDAKGNTVTTYSNNIKFNQNDISGSGNLLIDNNGLPNQGIATATFTASRKGEVTITVSADGLAGDSVTIKITDPDEPVKIKLDADPIKMKPGGEQSTITATIVNAGGEKVTQEDKQVEIIFIKSGPGTLDPSTDHTSGGVATTTLTSTNTSGTITVIATATDTDLEPGVVYVITGGEISLSASPILVPLNEISEITVTIKDVDGVPMNYAGTIKLNIVGTPPGDGTISTDTVNFNGSTSSMVVIFTATAKGTVEITASEDPSADAILTESELLSLTITDALEPDYIEVYANPSSIQAGGTETSTITARIKNVNKVTITSYTLPIDFVTSAGSFYSDDYGFSNEITLTSGDENYKNGVATVELYPPPVTEDSPEGATITVSSDTLLGFTVDVKFYVDAAYIELVCYPQYIQVKGGNPDSCVITATIKDNNDNIVYGYKGKVKFSITSGDAKFALTGSTLITVVNGEAQIILQAGNTPGLAIVEVTSSDIEVELPATIEIPVIGIQLTDDPIIYNPYDGVSFNINVQGAEFTSEKMLTLEQMQVSWDPSEGTLNSIEINPNSTGNLVIYPYPEGSPLISSGEIINVIKYVTLSKGESSNVKIYFDQLMYGMNMEVIFNTNVGNSSVNFIVPLLM